MNHFLTHYNSVALPQLKAAKQYDSEYLVPKVTRVVINAGIGDLLGNSKEQEEVAKLLATITGQKAIVTKARTSIAGFKVRAGMPVGMKVTLRGERMHNFLDRLIQIALPRTRDFRGLKPTGVTADGNLNIGIKDSLIFPEANPDQAGHGLQVTIVSNARSQEEAWLLFTSIGFVFQSEEEAKAAARTKKKRK